MSDLRPTVSEDWLIGSPAPPAWSNKASAYDDNPATCASGSLAMGQTERVQGLTLSGFPSGSGGVLKLDYQILSADSGTSADCAFVAYASLDGGVKWSPFVFDDAVSGEAKTASLQLASGQSLDVIKVRFGNKLTPAGLSAEGSVYAAVFDCRVELSGTGSTTPSGTGSTALSGKKAACNLC